MIETELDIKRGSFNYHRKKNDGADASDSFTENLRKNGVHITIYIKPDDLAVGKK